MYFFPFFDFKLAHSVGDFECLDRLEKNGRTRGGLVSDERANLAAGRFLDRNDQAPSFQSDDGFLNNALGRPVEKDAVQPVVEVVSFLGDGAADLFELGRRVAAHFTRVVNGAADG